MKVMKVEEIKVREPFNELFPIDPETLERIKEHMKTYGYDPSQPVPVWKGTLLDGHSRRKAAVESGIKEIPICEKEFSNEDEAIEYAIHNQVDRRNLTDGCERFSQDSNL
jgi:ParB-like chromosome segregation protein Spo0J